MADPKTNNPETDLLFTKEIVLKYVDFANDFTADLSLSLLPGIQLLFMSLVGLWCVYQGIKVISGVLSLQQLSVDFLCLIIAFMLLFGQGPTLVNTIYSGALSVIGSAAGLVINVGASGGGVATNIDGHEGMPALVGYVEQAVDKILDQAAVIMRQAKLTNPLPILYGLILVIPYAAILLVFFAQVVVSIFRIIMLATLSPFLMLAFGFGWGRGMALKGIKVLIATAMVLYGSTAAVAIVIYGVTSLKIGETGGLDIANISLTSPEFVLAVALGWLGTAFMAEATGIANSITESALTNTAAGIITAAGAATGYAVAKQVAAPAGAGAKEVGRGLIQGAGVAAGAGVALAQGTGAASMARNSFHNVKNAGLDKIRDHF